MKQYLDIENLLPNHELLFNGKPLNCQINVSVSRTALSYNLDYFELSGLTTFVYDNTLKLWHAYRNPGATIMQSVSPKIIQIVETEAILRATETKEGWY